MERWCYPTPYLGPRVILRTLAFSVGTQNPVASARLLQVLKQKALVFADEAYKSRSNSGWADTDEAPPIYGLHTRCMNGF